jgi:hypothetical protein
MLAPSGDLLRAGIGIKLNQIKTATRSYLRDRTDQATGTMTSYAVAAGLFAAAGVFLIAAFLVGAIALYRWVAIHYGQFWGFGAMSGLLVVLAAICAGVAAARLKRPPPHFPSLTSRLRVAIKSNPLKSGRIEAEHDPATSVRFTPSTPPSGTRASTQGLRARRPISNRSVQATGLIVMATLFGLAATRRRAHARQATSEDQHPV